jgi:hypothetical protein
MNVFLWVLQVLLALHTAMGAVWKFSSSEQAVDSLKALPHAVWMGLIPIELLCAAALLGSLFYKPLGKFAPIAAAVVAAEMLLFSAMHLASGVPAHGEMIYWLVVAAFCIFITVGRIKLSPLRPETT